MTHAVVFDCEFLVTEGSYSRFWCGPYDPDPIVAQIGAVKLDLSSSFDILDELKIFVNPVDRYGRSIKIPSFFTNLTGISAEQIGRQGVSLTEAVSKLNFFSNGAQMWSYGKDELNLMAISCYVVGIPSMIPANRFGNACKLLLLAGMPYEDIKTTRSGDLAAYFRLSNAKHSSHDGLEDARSIANVLQFLLREGRLAERDFIEKETLPKHLSQEPFVLR